MAGPATPGAGMVPSPVILTDAAGNALLFSGGSGPVIEVAGSAGLAIAQGLSVNNTAFSSLGAVLNGIPLGVYRSSIPTLTNNNYNPILLDVNGFLMETLGTLLAGENQTLNRLMTLPDYSGYFHSGTLSATNIKTGAGVLHCVSIDKSVASAVITLTDDTGGGAGTTLAKITLPGTLLADTEPTKIYDVAFSTGLTLTVATGGVDLTVSYL